MSRPERIQRILEDVNDLLEGSNYADLYDTFVTSVKSDIQAGAKELRGHLKTFLRSVPVSSLGKSADFEDWAQSKSSLKMQKLMSNKTGAALRALGRDLF
jgi:hypothetical protein